MKKQRGFTLLEILVVVTVLGILLVLLFPAFRSAKIAVRRTRCLTNIRQIGTALHDYNIANSNKLPYQQYETEPWGAVNSAASGKVLNSYLSGNGFATLECPSDQNSKPGTEYTYFHDKGFSYHFLSSGSNSCISAVAGNVTWQEEKMGYSSDAGRVDVAGTYQENFRNAMQYYGAGPETIPDPNAKDANGNYLRRRDVTQAEIDSDWVAISSWLQSQAGLQGYNVNAPQYRLGYNEATDPVTGKSLGYKNTNSWYYASVWSRNTYNVDYWKESSKKVAVLDYDATFDYVTPGSTSDTSASDNYPKTGKGFWHGYNYVPDPNILPTDPNYLKRLHVKCHAGFLDGHAGVIELNQITGFDSSNNPIYLPVDRDKNPIY